MPPHILALSSSLWHLNFIFASFFIGVLMRQELPPNHIDKLFLQVIRDVAHNVIYTKIARADIDYNAVYLKIIQEVFNRAKVSAKVAAKVAVTKITWVRPHWALLYLAQVLKPFESRCEFFHFIIEITNGGDTSLEKVFQLAFNIGQFIGNCKWYNAPIAVFLVCYLRMQYRWYHTNGDNLSNENYLHIYLHINAILSTYEA